VGFAVDQEKRALANRSNRLLDALRRMRETEKRKRQEPISTPKFHELANEVDRASREVFRLAREQDELGEEIPTGRDTIADVDRSTRAEGSKRN
jgi:hypothetical protein